MAPQKSKPSPYRGRLNPFQISAGIRSTKANARRLFEDAKLLYDNGRYPTAMSLAVLAVEEFGKLPILRRMALAETDSQWSRCWRHFSDHLAKNMSWVVPSLVKEISNAGELFELFQRHKDADVINSLKQVGLYVGCYGKAHWCDPGKTFDRKDADITMGAATFIAYGSADSEFDTPAEVQRWATWMRGNFLVDPIVANNLIVEFLLRAPEIGSLPAGAKIPHNVAFEWASTAIYISHEVDT